MQIRFNARPRSLLPRTETDLLFSTNAVVQWCEWLAAVMIDEYAM